MQHDLFDITDLRDFAEGKETLLELLLRLNKRHREGSDWTHKADELPQDHITPLLRPDAPGFFWCLRNSGRHGEQWHVVKAAFIQWPEDDDDSEQIKVLACTSGGCWQRCDYINKGNQDDGERYFRLVPPTLLT
jgi:hypothetical protein